MFSASVFLVASHHWHCQSHVCVCECEFYFFFSILIWVTSLDVLNKFLLVFSVSGLTRYLLTTSRSVYHTLLDILSLEAPFIFFSHYPSAVFQQWYHEMLYMDAIRTDVTWFSRVFSPQLSPFDWCARIIVSTKTSTQISKPRPTRSALSGKMTRPEKAFIFTEQITNSLFFI